MPCVPASVKSPTFKSFKQVIAMGEIVGTVRGSLAGRAAPGEPDDKVDQLLFVADWRRCLQSWQCFLRPSVSSPNDWSPICGGSMGEGTGGEGAKNDRSPRRGTGIRASRPRSPCRAWTARGRHGHWPPGPVVSSALLAARHRRDGDVLRCDIWTWTRRGEPKPPPRADG